jgi:hypothetical protein
MEWPAARCTIARSAMHRGCAASETQAAAGHAPLQGAACNDAQRTMQQGSNHKCSHAMEQCSDSLQVVTAASRREAACATHCRYLARQLRRHDFVYAALRTAIVRQAWLKSKRAVPRLARCMLLQVARCRLHAVGCTSAVACRVLHVVLHAGGCKLCASWRPSHVVCCMLYLARSLLHVVCCMLCVARSLLRVACCMRPRACQQWPAGTS